MTDRLVLLPALDVAAGRAVRPAEVQAGSASPVRPPGEDPLEAALRLQGQGAEWIHLVDLDAAYGRGSNADLLKVVVGALDIPVQISGGILDAATFATASAMGAARINLSTGALTGRAWVTDVLRRHGPAVCIALDVEGDRLRPRGGKGSDCGSLDETLDWLTEVGAARYVVTDVHTDGAMTGPNTALLRRVCRATSRPVVASGGVATTEHLRQLAALAEHGVEGVVLGTALSAGAFTFREALAAVSS